MTQRTSAWSGWISFATVMLTMIGAFNIAEGLAALMLSTVSYIDAGRLVVVSLTAWGVLALVSGALLVAIGLGLFARNELARTAAVVLIALHALIQLAALAAFPIWSLLMIALDVVVLFALTVHWGDATVEAQAQPQQVADARAAGGGPI
jgi:type III secretory pathway component EscV